MDESHCEGRPECPAADDVRLERRGLERRTLHRFKQAAAAAFAWRRCLVPADAFYEWKSGKQPYAIARQDGMPVTFAGIWEGWRAPDGEVLRTFAILTTSANGTGSQLHERIPVILEPRDWPIWLGEVAGDAPGADASGGG